MSLRPRARPRGHTIAAACAPGDRAGQAVPAGSRAGASRRRASAGAEPRAAASISASQDPRVALERLHPAAGLRGQPVRSEREFPELANPLAMTFDDRGRLWVLTSPTYPHVAARPEAGRQARRPRGHQRRRPGRHDHGLRRRALHPDRLRARRRRRLRLAAAEPDVPEGHQRRRQGRRAADHPARLRHRGQPPRDPRLHVGRRRRPVLPGGHVPPLAGRDAVRPASALENAGVFRYEPRTEKLDVFVSYPFANPWGHVIDRWGQNFVSDASNGNNYWGTPFSGHVDYPRKQRTMKEWTLTPRSGRRPASSSSAAATSPTARRATSSSTTSSASTASSSTSRRGGRLGLRGDRDRAAAAVVRYRTSARSRCRFGPDGALYVVDWFNPLVGHMQVLAARCAPRQDARPRLARSRRRAGRCVTRPRIHGESIEAQLDLLKAYEDRTRYHARLALREQPTGAVHPGAQEMDGRPRRRRIPTTSTICSRRCGCPSTTTSWTRPLLKRVLEAKEFRARAAGVRVLQLLVRSRRRRDGAAEAHGQRPGAARAAGGRASRSASSRRPRRPRPR